MKFIRGFVAIWALVLLAAYSQEVEGPLVDPEETLPEAVSPQEVERLSIPDDGVRVSVLGYHDFSETERETAMRIRTSKFKEQMEQLRELGIEVISMEDFVAWKKGEKEIPKRSVVITIDDGWKSVYTDAFPILKALGYPFTIYLYKNYVDGGGKALTTPMIKEMLANGATIGSHSSTHPFPQEVKKARKAGETVYDKLLDIEMRDSKKFLEKKFGGSVKTYAYPGGYFTEEMLGKADEVGYTHLFTVQPGKVKREVANNILPRYIILGNYDKIFQFATTFRDPNAVVSAESLVKELPFPVNPQPGSIINSRLPVIEVDFSQAENIDLTSLKMKVAGYGEVPANYASEGKLFSWQVNRRLRQEVCSVEVSWKNLGGESLEEPLEWSFQIDREAAYLPDE
ncbi:MAG: polysaccharide deacetylase family protein [Akkermansiaceae bacterium]